MSLSKKETFIKACVDSFQALSPKSDVSIFRDRMAGICADSFNEKLCYLNSYIDSIVLLNLHSVCLYFSGPEYRAALFSILSNLVLSQVGVFQKEPGSPVGKQYGVLRLAIEHVREKRLGRVSDVLDLPCNLYNYPLVLIYLAASDERFAKHLLENNWVIKGNKFGVNIRDFVLGVVRNLNFGTSEVRSFGTSEVRKQSILADHLCKVIEDACASDKTEFSEVFDLLNKQFENDDGKDLAALDEEERALYAADHNKSMRLRMLALQGVRKESYLATAFQNLEFDTLRARAVGSMTSYLGIEKLMRSEKDTAMWRLLRDRAEFLEGEQALVDHPEMKNLIVDFNFQMFRWGYRPYDSYGVFYCEKLDSLLVWTDKGIRDQDPTFIFSLKDKHLAKMDKEEDRDFGHLIDVKDYFSQGRVRELLLESLFCDTTIAFLKKNFFHHSFVFPEADIVKELGPIMGKLVSALDSRNLAGVMHCIKDIDKSKVFVQPCSMNGSERAHMMNMLLSDYLLYHVSGWTGDRVEIGIYNKALSSLRSIQFKERLATNLLHSLAEAKQKHPALLPFFRNLWTYFLSDTGFTHDQIVKANTILDEAGFYLSEKTDTSLKEAEPVKKEDGSIVNVDCSDVFVTLLRRRCKLSLSDDSLAVFKHAIHSIVKDYIASAIGSQRPKDVVDYIDRIENYVLNNFSNIEVFGATFKAQLLYVAIAKYCYYSHVDRPNDIKGAKIDVLYKDAGERLKNILGVDIAESVLYSIARTKEKLPFVWDLWSHFLTEKITPDATVIVRNILIEAGFDLDGKGNVSFKKNVPVKKEDGSIPFEVQLSVQDDNCSNQLIAILKQRCKLSLSDNSSALFKDYIDSVVRGTSCDIAAQRPKDVVKYIDHIETYVFNSFSNIQVFGTAFKAHLLYVVIDRYYHDKPTTRRQEEAGEKLKNLLGIDIAQYLFYSIARTKEKLPFVWELWSHFLIENFVSHDITLITRVRNILIEAGFDLDGKGNVSFKEDAPTKKEDLAKKEPEDDIENNALFKSVLKDLEKYDLKIRNNVNFSHFKEKMRYYAKEMGVNIQKKSAQGMLACIHNIGRYAIVCFEHLRLSSFRISTYDILLDVFGVPYDLSNENRQIAQNIGYLMNISVAQGLVASIVHAKQNDPDNVPFVLDVWYTFFEKSLLIDKRNMLGIDRILSDELGVSRKKKPSKDVGIPAEKEADVTKKTSEENAEQTFGFVSDNVESDPIFMRMVAFIQDRKNICLSTNAHAYSLFKMIASAIISDLYHCVRLVNHGSGNVDFNNFCVKLGHLYMSANDAYNIYIERDKGTLVLYSGILGRLFCVHPQDRDEATVAILKDKLGEDLATGIVSSFVHAKKTNDKNPGQVGFLFNVWQRLLSQHFVNSDDVDFVMGTIKNNVIKDVVAKPLESSPKADVKELARPEDKIVKDPHPLHNMGDEIATALFDICKNGHHLMKTGDMDAFRLFVKHSIDVNCDGMYSAIKYDAGSPHSISNSGSVPYMLGFVPLLKFVYQNDILSNRPPINKSGYTIASIVDDAYEEHRCGAPRLLIRYLNDLFFRFFGNPALPDHVMDFFSIHLLSVDAKERKDVIRLWTQLVFKNKKQHGFFEFDDEMMRQAIQNLENDNFFVDARRWKRGQILDSKANETDPMASDQNLVHEEEVDESSSEIDEALPPVELSDFKQAMIRSSLNTVFDQMMEIVKGEYPGYGEIFGNPTVRGMLMLFFNGVLSASKEFFGIDNDIFDTMLYQAKKEGISTMMCGGLEVGQSIVQSFTSKIGEMMPLLTRNQEPVHVLVDRVDCVEER